MHSSLNFCIQPVGHWAKVVYCFLRKGVGFSPGARETVYRSPLKKAYSFHPPFAKELEQDHRAVLRRRMAGAPRVCPGHHLLALQPLSVDIPCFPLQVEKIKRENLPFISHRRPPGPSGALVRYQVLAKVLCKRGMPIMPQSGMEPMQGCHFV